MAATRSLAFADRAIRGATFLGAGNETQYRIIGHPGLVLSVLPGPDRKAEGGRRTWRYFYSFVDGESRRVRKITLGVYPALTLASAAKLAADLAVRVAGEGDVVALDRASAEAQANAAQLQASEEARAKLTFADLLTEYIAERQDLLRIDETERELKKDALPALGPKQPNEVTAADIDRIAAAIRARGSTVMAQRIITLIKALYNYCLLDRPALADKYGLTHNPADRLGRRRYGTTGVYTPKKARTRVLDDSEIARWWHALEASGTSPRTRLGLLLVLATAQRPGEVRSARRADLHRLTGANPLWILPVDTLGKKRAAQVRADHVVPLSPLAVSLFKQALELSSDDALVFGEDGEPPGSTLWPTVQANLFANHLADLPPATVHDLRRTAATGMRRIGTDRDVVSQILNHAPKNVTEIHYDHYDGLAEKRAALELWGGWLAKLSAADSP